MLDKQNYLYFLQKSTASGRSLEPKELKKYFNVCANFNPITNLTQIILL